MTGTPSTLTESAFARQVLFGETLADKLGAPERVIPDAEPAEPVGDVAFPGRPKGLRRGEGATMPFPKREALADPVARGRILHYFANHELLALELMALALLRFPTAPAPFRAGIVRTMREEQAHLRLYLARMAELGVTFGDLAVSDFFWNALKGMASPYEYVTGMSLTFEQANLDFSLHYRDLFAAVGDHETAAILERVYQEEIGHVKHGVAWFGRWRPAGEDAWTSYVASLRLPLSPSRAKAQPFDRAGRRAAGLDDEFIRRLDVFGGSKGRPPTVFWFNPDVEIEVAQALDRETPRRGADAYTPMARHAGMMAETESVLTFLAREGDVVLCRKTPPLDLLEEWKAIGVSLPEYREAARPEDGIRAMRQERRVMGPLSPWGWGPRALAWAAEMQGQPFDEDAAIHGLARLYGKTELPALRAAVRAREPALLKGLGPEAMDGRLVQDEEELTAFAREVAADLGASLLVKAPYSAAGRERLRIDGGKPTDQQRGWLAKAWRKWGTLLAEPFVQIVADGSLLAENSAKDGAARAAPSLFLCDARGQYRGHRLIPRGFAGFPDEIRSFLMGRGETGSSLAEALSAAAAHAFATVAGWGYQGRAGVDFHVYRLPGDERLYLQAVGEVNARTTMGHVALALTRHMLPGEAGLWLTLRAQELAAAGAADFATLAARLRAEAPLVVTTRERTFASSGIFFTNDPATARHALGVVAVGDAAMARLSAVAGLG